MTKFKKTILPNGVRVVSEFHPQPRAVSIGIWVETGTRDENADQAGISHLIEHLVFKGTKTRTAYQIARSLEALGGDLNAFTTKEHTCYHALVLKQHWLTALDVVADLVCSMQISRKDFLLEKGVILQEIAMSDDSHEEYVHDAFFDRVYGKHPLARPILGTVKSITESTLGGVMSHYREMYNGSNLVVAAAGAIDHQELVDAVAEKLRTKKKSRKQSKRRAPRWISSRDVIERDGEQVHCLLGFPAPSFKDKQRFEAFILNACLGGGMTSRLFQAVRERKGLVYSIHSSLNTFVDCGQITIYAGAESEKVREVIEIVAREVRKVKKQGISRSDVEMFKTQVIGGILLGADDVDNRMHSLGVNELVFGKYRPVDEIVAEIENVSEDSVDRYLRERLKPEQMAGVLLGPRVRDLGSWLKELEF